MHRVLSPLQKQYKFFLNQRYKIKHMICMQKILAWFFGKVTEAMLARHFWCI